MLANALRATTFVGLVLLAGTAPGQATPSAPGGGPALPALQTLKTLAGDWVAAEDGEMAKRGTLVAHYAVSAAGSAVVETLFPGSPHEMVTVYHADGDDLVLTHYCTEGNQPRMRARPGAGRRLEFAYDGGSNIDPEHDRHMHSAWLELIGPDELRSEWTELAEGKPVFVAKSHLVRQSR